MNQTIYAFDQFQIDTQKRLLLRDGQPVQLTSKAFDLLLALLESGGRELTKDELMETVWSNQIVEDANLTVTMSQLRKALGEKANEHRFIVTIPGRGYRFVAKLRKPEGFIIEEHIVSLTTIEEEIVSDSDALQQEEWKNVTVLKNQENAIISLTNNNHLNKSDIVGVSPPLALKPQSNKAFFLQSRYFIILLAGIFVSLLLGIAAITWFFQFRNKQAQATTPPNSKQVTMRRFTTHGGVPYRAAISPDGKSLAYIQRVKGKDSLWLGQIETNNSLPIYEQSDLEVINPSFSPDGNNVYFVVKGNRPNAMLVRMSVLGGAITELIPGVSSPVTFSPSGKQMAFLRHDSEMTQTSIVITDSADGKNEQTLITLKSPEGISSNGLSWSPDNKTIAFGVTKSSGQSEIVIVNLFDRSEKKIGQQDWGSIDNLVWLPEGNGMIVVGKENVGQVTRRIWLVSYPDGKAEIITNDLNIFLQPFLSISANGKLAVLQGRVNSEIWITSYNDIKNARRILRSTALGYEGVRGLAWTPEGHLLYTAYVGGNQVIWTMNGDGGNLRQLTPGNSNVSDSNMCVTADGRYVVFQSNRSGEVEIWRVNMDGSDLKQLTNGGNNSSPSLSPDGQWIVYTSVREGKPKLWRISIDGTDAKQLVDTFSIHAQVSPDGKYIAYMEESASADNRLTIIRFESGEFVKSFVTPKNSIWGFQVIRWSPDSKAVIYKNNQQGLWQQALNEETPKMIKGFENLPLRHFAFSFDGKSMVYAAGETTQEIILMENFQ